jgi:hypothetical protein
MPRSRSILIIFSLRLNQIFSLDLNQNEAVN